MSAANSSDCWPTDADSYNLISKIGRGAFAEVFKAYCPSRAEYCAIKVLDMDELETSWEEIRKEMSLVKLLQHANIANAFCCFVNGLELYLVMPLFEGGSCSDVLKRRWPTGIKDEALLATILREALQGLAYLHKDARIHRDVKAGNILLGRNGSVKLADFGVAASLIEAGHKRHARKTFTGTPCYMAPEVMEQVKGHNVKADIWSLGITALELAFGRPPYAKHRPMKIMLMVLQSEPPSLGSYDDTSYDFSKSFKNFVRDCLMKDPAKRHSAEKLLKHNFIKKNAKDTAYVVEKLIDGLALESLDATKPPKLPKALRRRKELPPDKQPVSVQSWVFDDESNPKKQSEREEAELLSPRSAEIEEHKSPRPSPSPSSVASPKSKSPRDRPGRDSPTRSRSRSNAESLTRTKSRFKVSDDPSPPRNGSSSSSSRPTSPPQPAKVERRGRFAVTE